MTNFSDLPIMPKIQKAITLLGFIKPTEIQSKVIPILISNKSVDIHAQAQTGTGKTIAFGIPLLHKIDQSIKAVQGLVVAPTRELVLQIYESLKEISRETGIIIEPIYGGMPINRQITNIKRGAQIIIGTPGRLIDHIKRKTLSLKSVNVVVLDEADIMLDMGFKEEVEAIINYTPSERQIWLFSATVMPGIKHLIKSHMKNVVSVKVEEKTVTSAQVKQYFCIVQPRKRIEAIARFVEVSPDFYGIIFCQTKVLAGEATEELASKGFKVNCLHGDMKQTLRNHVIKGFKNKDFNILLATDVAGRGIDVSNLTHVINFSLPDELEKYIHRIGRTGRAGKEGIAITLISNSEIYRIKRLEKIVNAIINEIPIPPIDTIINVKITAVSDFIEQSKKPNLKLTPVHKALNEIINSFTAEEIKNAFAIALEDKFFKDVLNEDLRNLNNSSTNIPQEICIELGNEKGFNEQTIRNYLYSTCKLLPQEIRKVRVLQNKTFISIPANRLRECLETMQKKPITSIKYKAYLVENIPYNQKYTKKPDFNDRNRRRKRNNFRNK